jgi:hypothetical protein
MSKAYHNSDASEAETKIESRYKIAQSIKATGKHHKVIHYFGGVDPSTPFENYFPILRTTFVRYEWEPSCPTPNHYVDAQWVENGEALVEKPLNKIGYFCNGNFFEEVDGFTNIFGDMRNYFWLDFCNTPKQDIVDNVYSTFFAPDAPVECAEEIYLTFFLNARGKRFPSMMMNRYGESLDARALSVCDSLRERFSVDNYQFSVFDVYLNGNSPMGVIKINKQ